MVRWGTGKNEKLIVLLSKGSDEEINVGNAGQFISDHRGVRKLTRIGNTLPTKFVERHHKLGDRHME